MNWIPGWDSVDGAHFWSNFFFWGSIFGLILLGVFEIFSHRYSERKDELTAIEQANTQRRHDDEMARLHLEAAQATERTEELRKENLELQKNVRGREITDKQHDQIIAAMHGKQVPDLVTNIAHDPEAYWYAFSIISIFQDLGMPGRVNFLEGQPPLQTGVMYCGAGAEADRDFMQALMDAGVVTVGTVDARPPNMGHDRDGGFIVLPYCPPGSIFVGTRPPLSTFRMPKSDKPSAAP